MDWCHWLVIGLILVALDMGALGTFPQRGIFLVVVDAGSNRVVGLD
jgi:hypothetical protein